MTENVPQKYCANKISELKIQILHQNLYLVGDGVGVQLVWVLPGLKDCSMESKIETKLPHCIVKILFFVKILSLYPSKKKHDAVIDL